MTFTSFFCCSVSDDTRGTSDIGDTVATVMDVNATVILMLLMPL